MTLKHTLTAASLVMAFAATPAFSEHRELGDPTLTAQQNMLPPIGYAAQRWAHPNGCQYTRAGRPGETVWYLIINSRGNKKCTGFVVEKPMEGTTIAAYYNTYAPKRRVTRNIFRLPLGLVGLN